ncbi:membrane protein [Pilimelia anulata]|uniref:Membrane protein n=1 Tax=Pilimelia anulata TaxID=53371 RepID=A0A8J3BB59_9ACTN|nr:YcnI family protein [Pilimelia anulata]GGK06404.1 membrane protein [Pilimelia anulata]
MLRLRSALPAALLSVAATAGALLIVAAPAAAHVTINAEKAVQGGFARAAVRVPNESPTASTIKLEVSFPTDQPLASVSYEPVAGWVAAVVKGAPSKPVSAHGSEVKEVVSKITWTAPATGGIKPGQFQEFPISLGPLPHADQLVFKAVQTYSDGTISRWIQETPAGGEEPENPAPVLKLAAAPEGADEHGEGGTTEAGDHDKSGSNGAALGLAIAGLVLALVGVALGALALKRSGTRSA